MSDHACDRKGPPAKVTDEWGNEALTAIYPTCSVCGKPQVFQRSDQQDKVRDWFAKSGYPLEMRIAKGLRDSGFTVVQAEYFEDPDTGKWRETDVIAYTESSSETCHVASALVVECKASPKPWILLTTTVGYAAELSVTRRASSTAGSSILSALSFKAAIRNSLLFRVPPRYGYGLTVAFRKDRGEQQDAAYDALNSVCPAALALVRSLVGVKGHQIVPFAFPTIVIDAPLFECYIDDNGDEQLQEIRKGLLVWRNPRINRHTLVDIYTADEFLAEGKQIRAAMTAFVSAASVESDRSPRTPDGRATQRDLPEGDSFEPPE